jgi:Ser/Thr protein kinase RdoA (MazF antagonist)
VEYFLKTLTALINEIELLLGKKLPWYGLIHGDVNFGNLRYSGNNKLYFIDFELCSNYYRLLDLSNLADAFHFGLDTGTHLNDKTEEIISGYNSVRKISENEEIALSIFPVIRSIVRYSKRFTDVYDFGDNTNYKSDQFLEERIRQVRLYLKKNSLLSTRSYC